MQFQIRNIVLWPRNTDFNPRVINFRPGMLNVITGASRTGKTAIIPIIDYCLASTKCTIPVDIIRDSCLSFGIVILLQDEQILFARECPKENAASSKMYYLRDKKIEIPHNILNYNRSVDEVKSILDGISGIPYLSLDDDSENGFQSRPSFRDLISFNFQPQNIVANQNVLFYKVESYEYRERLKNVFPFALSIITAEILLKQHKLKRIRKALQQKENEYKKLKHTSLSWETELISNVTKAIEYGIWPVDANNLSNDKDYLTSILKQICDKTDIEPILSEKTIDYWIEAIKELRCKERDFSMLLAEHRKSKSELYRLKASLESRNNVSILKRDRLKLAEWFFSKKNNDVNCPTCGNMFVSESEDLKKLCDSFRLYEDEAFPVIEMPPAFYREYEYIDEDIRQTIESLRGVQFQIKELETSTETLKKQRYTRDTAIRFIGSLQSFINTLEDIHEDGSLVHEIEELENQVKELEKDVADHKIKTKFKNVLSRISILISSILPDLDIEHKYSKAPCELSIIDLSLKITLDSNIKYFLSEIGSGSNWLSYHVALTVALQKYFSADKNSPVPGFIVYDQPSQVYFPRRLADEGKRQSGEEDNAEKFRDEDVEAVKKIFFTISSEIKNDNGAWQAIILDHAPESVWGDIDNVHKVAEWRDGEKLIPNEWIVK